MAKKKQKMEGPSPEGMRAQRRRLQRHRDEIRLYQMIEEKEFDLFRKEDPTYVGAKAREIDWSRGRFTKALDRIWSEAKRDIAKADKIKADKGDGEVQNDEQQS